MNIPGEERAAENSGTADSEGFRTSDPDIHVEDMDTLTRAYYIHLSNSLHANTDFNSTPIFEQIYKDLSRESKDRILSILEREQGYEKKALQQALWTQRIGFALGFVGLTIAVTSLIFVGSNGKSPWWAIAVAGIGAGAGAFLIEKVTEYWTKRPTRSTIRDMMRHWDLLDRGRRVPDD